MTDSLTTHQPDRPVFIVNGTANVTLVGIQVTGCGEGEAPAAAQVGYYPSVASVSSGMVALFVSLLQKAKLMGYLCILGATLSVTDCRIQSNQGETLFLVADSFIALQRTLFRDNLPVQLFHAVSSSVEVRFELLCVLDLLTS